MPSRTKSKQAEEEVEEQEENSRSGNRPVFKQRCFTGGGYVDVAVFERTNDSHPDQPPTYYVSAKKSFKDERGWHEGSLFQPYELLILARAATAAYDWIAQQQTA